MAPLQKQSPFIQLATLFGLWFVFLILYAVLTAVLFPTISGGYTIDQMQDPGLFKVPRFLTAIKISQLLYTVTCFLLPALIFTGLVYRKPMIYLGLQRGVKPFQLLLALLIMLCALPLVGAMSEWNATWPVSKGMREMEDMAAEQTKALLKGSGSGTLIFNLFLLALVPAIAEEVFFRGALQRVITQIVKNGWVATVIAAILFSTIHLQFLGFMPRLLLGFLLGAIFFVSGNLWLSIAGHFLNNGLQVVLVYLYNARMITYDATKDDHVPIYMAIVSTLVAGLLLWQLHKKARQAGQTFALPAETLPRETQEDDPFKIFND